jgi:hypothetical protein
MELSPLAILEDAIKRRFDDATSEEIAADCRGTCSDRSIAANPRTARREKV